MARTEAHTPAPDAGAVGPGPRQTPPALIDHPALKTLLADFKAYAQSGLSAVQSGRKQFNASEASLYAAAVMERVVAVDDTMASLHIASTYLHELSTQAESATALHRYHYENFILRTIGGIDRVYRLIGAVLRLDPRRYDSSTGNRHVDQYVQLHHPGLHASVAAIHDLGEHYRAIRNALIHADPYSNRDLCMFDTAHRLGDRFEPIDTPALYRDCMRQRCDEVDTRLAQLQAAISTVLDQLAPLLRNGAAVAAQTR
ncbi:Cthe_2314 family HEPN domain-containing protein [Lysobacter sp. Root690]|uniref:Cthe_2314 family HEPN domain-containing protein n=1 Tax=Lysobacter sp. Root690 TaxID=1736588 RepID=UPI000A65B3E8|nr:Cthe_2314 family HEPN domain-containing protein [Lysobacter sp. Root690]